MGIRDSIAGKIVKWAQKRQYAAAKTSLSTGGWNPVDERVNEILGSSNANLRSRARQLVRDMPAMATAIDRLEEFTIGTGLTLQSRIIDPSTGKLAKSLNQSIEDAWNYWCEEADASGKLHFNEIQQLFCRNANEVGEYVAIKKYDNRRNRYLPYSLMILEADDLVSYSAETATGNEINQGVEYNKRTGEVIAYHFENSDRWKKPIRVLKDQVVIGFKTLRPGQLRGVTPLAPAILLAHSLRDYLEAEIASAQKAARWLAFVTSADPDATMKAFGAAQSSTYQDTGGNYKHTMEMGHAIVDFMRTGEDVKIADHNRPGDSFKPFVKFIQQTFAATVGVTYELLSGDYYDAKYTAARVSRNDMNRGLNVSRTRIERQLCNNIRKEFMNWAVMTGKIDLPNYFSNPAPYFRSVWLGDGQELLDPLREGRAQSDAMADYRKSPQEIIVGSGRDPEQVLDEFAEWNEMLKERDLPTAEEKKQALQTNPSAVAPGTGNLDGKKSIKLLGANK